MLVAVVGATGLVGTKMLRVLEERNFPVTELLPVASERSWGKKVTFQGKEWTVISAAEAIARKPALAIFSAGGAASGELAPQFAAVGCRVVDNSSYWRMDPTVPLVVPEINPDAIGPDNYIIANPNCSFLTQVLDGLIEGFGTQSLAIRYSTVLRDVHCGGGELHFLHMLNLDGQVGVVMVVLTLCAQAQRGAYHQRGEEEFFHV